MKDITPRCSCMWIPDVILKTPGEKGCKITAWSPVLGEKQIRTAIQCLVSHPFPVFFCSALYHKGLTLLVSIWFGQWRKLAGSWKAEKSSSQNFIPLYSDLGDIYGTGHASFCGTSLPLSFSSVVSFSIGIPGSWVLIIPYFFFFLFKSLQPKGCW